MTEKKVKRTKLKIFEGKEAKLNRKIFEILKIKKLSKYDISLELRRIKGYRHTSYPTTNQRVNTLFQTKWVTKDGKRKTRSGQETGIYKLATKAQVAMHLDKIDLNALLNNAPEWMLTILKDTLDTFINNYPTKQKTIIQNNLTCSGPSQILGQ